MMIASQFSRSWDSCHRNVTGCLATCWMVQNASWSQLEPGKMMTPNFIALLHQSLARKKKNPRMYESRSVWRAGATFKTFHWEEAAARAAPERNPVAAAQEEVHQVAATAER